MQHTYTLDSYRLCMHMKSTHAQQDICSQMLWKAAVFRFDWYTVMLQLVSSPLT